MENRINKYNHTSEHYGQDRMNHIQDIATNKHNLVMHAKQHEYKIQRKDSQSTQKEDYLINHLH